MPQIVNWGLLMAIASVSFEIHSQSLLATYGFGKSSGTYNPTIGSGFETKIAATTWTATGTAVPGKSGSLKSTLDFVDRGGVGFAPSSSGKAVTTKSWPSFALKSPDLNESVYESFTIKPTAGNTLSVTSLTFDVGTGKGSDLIQNLKVEVLTGSTVKVVQSSMTLSSSEFGNSITFSFIPQRGTFSAPVEFRFLAYNAKQNDSPLYIDNVSAYGKVNSGTTPPVPELPSTAVVVGCCLGGYAWTRRVVFQKA